MGKGVRRWRGESWRKEPKYKMFMRKSASATPLFLPSVISRWQTSQQVLSLT